MARREAALKVDLSGPSPSLHERRLTTPVVLRAALVLAWVPVAAFAVAVHVSADRNERTVATVGREATRGIAVAQEIKLNLAELDAIVVEDLLAPPTIGPSGFPDEYNAKRQELHANLVVAAAEAVPGVAYRQPLADVDYALGHYHALVRESFSALQAGDLARATEVYGEAHDVMAGTLHAQVDALDQANSFVLDDTYGRHKDEAIATLAVIVVTWVVLLAFLAVAQIQLAREFRRMLNPALVLASVLAVFCGPVTVARIDSASENLSSAREEAFDAVHALARAQAVAVAAHQAQGQGLLEQTDAEAAQYAFTAEASDLFRIRDRTPGEVEEQASLGEAPLGSGGHLTRALEAGDGAADRATEDALRAFGGFLSEDADLRAQLAGGDRPGAIGTFEAAPAFDELIDSIETARDTHQTGFEHSSRAAADNIRPLGPITLVVSAAILLLITLGLYLRLREFSR